MKRTASKSSTAESFFRALFRDQSGYLCVAAMLPSKKLEQRFFQYPDGMNAALAYIRHMDAEEHDVYFCAHLLTAKARKKEYAADIVTLWADLDDGARLPEDFAEPTITVESSPGRFHMYWCLEEAITPGTAEGLNRRIASAIRADASGWDLTQLLRVPNTRNFKRVEPTDVRLTDETETVWSVDAIERAAPEIKSPTKDRGAGEHVENARIGPPPVPLQGRALKRWRGSLMSKSGGEIDRSKTLVAIAMDLRRSGASRDQIIEALTLRDSLSPFQKYRDRDDATLRYEELADRAMAEVPVPAQTLIESSPVSPGFDPTDMGNAERLVKTYGHLLRRAGGQLYAWDGKRFTPDRDVALTLAMRSIKSIQSESGLHDVQQAAKVWMHAQKSQSASSVHASLALAVGMPEIRISMDDFDARLDELNLPNGMLHLTSGALSPHDPGHMHTKVAGVAYDPSATCPRWLRFIAQTFGDDPKVIEYVQRLCGYFLSGSTKEQKFFIFQGGGANGKSVLLETVRAMLGEYGVVLPQLTAVSKIDKLSNDVAMLQGRRLATISELPSGRVLDQALMKHLTGDDKITARGLYKEYTEFRISAKIVIATNHFPKVSGADNAIWRRIEVLPFDFQVPRSKQDKDLANKLRKELPGILNWAIEGYIAWTREGLNPPPKVTEAALKYRSDQDVEGRFIQEQCLPDSRSRVSNATLRAEFQWWCEEEGIGNPGEFNVIARLKALGYAEYRTNSERGLRGLRLRSASTGWRLSA